MLKKAATLSALVASSYLMAATSQASIISSVSTNDTSANYNLNEEALMNGSSAFSDSGETWLSIPEYLMGADYIETAQTDNSNSDLEVSVSFNGDGTLYFFHADELDLPAWASSAFTDTGDTISLAGPVTGSYSVYSMMVSSDSDFTFLDNDPNTTNSGLMYGIAAIGDGSGDMGGDNGGANAVSAPATFALFSLGLAGLMSHRRSNRK